MMTKLSAWALAWVNHFGYWGLGWGMGIGSFGLPIPSEVLLPLAGVAIRQGRLSWFGVITISVVAQLLGAILSYWIGVVGGEAVIKRYGKYLLFREQELAKAHSWFERYGGWVTFFGRCVPGLRTYVGYPAGVAQMNFGRFVVATIGGSLVWTVLLVWLGYQLNGHLVGLQNALHTVGLVVLGLIVVALGWYVKTQLSKKRKS